MEGLASPDSQQPKNGWWRKHPWIRHSVYWAIALGVIALSTFDGAAAAVSSHANDVEFIFLFHWHLAALVVAGLAVIGLAFIGLIRALREWEQVPPAQTTSRSLVSFTFLLAALAALLFFARRWGVHIEACRTVGEMETCQGQASPQRVLGMLAWHAADVVPGVDITQSLDWQRPARSSEAVVGVSVLAVRLWVAIGILGVFKRMWDKWGPGGSSPTVSHSVRLADEARRAPGGPPKAEPSADAGPAAPQAPP